MNKSYRATLKGNVLEWHDRVPATTEKLEVSVVILEPPLKEQPSIKEQGQRMAQILQALANNDTFGNVDAVVWQKEQRLDRSLPNRDD
jgi:hypothetical protein